jgi:hypothetical protein
MSEYFPYDVFISHNSADNALVRPIAERLRNDGLRVWYDEWEIRPGDNTFAKIEQGLEQSRLLILCMSAAALGSDWPLLESATFRFRDPQNKDRRFIPLRLDDTPAKGSLPLFAFIDWRKDVRDREYDKLLEACRSVETKSVPVIPGCKDHLPRPHRIDPLRLLQPGWSSRCLSLRRQYGADVGVGDGAGSAGAGRPHQHKSGA